MYVFAITQLSDSLVRNPTVKSALQALILLSMVWLVWVYTTWVTNFLDPSRIPLRIMMLVLMAAGLAMAALIPRAFTSAGLAVSCLYVGMQLGRCVISALVTRKTPLGANFRRILAWCMISGTVTVFGGIAHGADRELLWAASLLIDLFGSTIGFWTPGIGRSTTADWLIEGNHFAERCQAFILIALGESIVEIGATFAGIHGADAQAVVSFIGAFIAAAALWWIYFNSTADAAASVIAKSPDPGRLGRSAYHFVHLIIVAGIVVIAAADKRVLDNPGATIDTATALMVCGGSGLFIAGDIAFIGAVWRRIPLDRVLSLVALVLIGIVARHASALIFASCTGVLLVALAAADRPSPASDGPDRGASYTASGAR